jgi:hypothetical protein
VSLKLIEYEYYNWNNLITDTSKQSMVTDIDTVIDQGNYWKNSPPYQTTINIFGLPKEDWVNLKMSFIWSCFAYMKQERQIKTIKSWAYKTNIDTQENRDRYWHQHIREGSLSLSGVFYLHIPDGADLATSGTEFSHTVPEDKSQHFFASAKPGHWIIWPGKAWHRPGILQSKDWRYIVAADMEM